MELKEAIEILKGLIEPQRTLLSSFDKKATETVLAELDKKVCVRCGDSITERELCENCLDTRASIAAEERLKGG